MAQVRRFSKTRWCFHIGPIQVVWMSRPMNDKTEYLLNFSITK